MSGKIKKITSIVFIMAGTLLAFFSGFSEQQISLVVSGALTLAGAIATFITFISKD